LETNRKVWQAENIWEYVAAVAIKRFEEAGLFPLNPLVVTSSFKIEPSKLFSQQETETTENKEPKRPEVTKIQAAETSQQKTQNPDNRELNRRT